MKKGIIVLIAFILINMFSTMSFAMGSSIDDVSEEQLVEAFLEDFKTEDNTISYMNEETEEIDKAEPCDATIDMDFSENEVLVVMTKEQSRLKQEYTASDFPQLNNIVSVRCLMNTSQQSDKYSILLITLNENDKEKVLDTIKILEGLDYVYAAEPNYYLEMLEQVEYINTTINAIEPSGRSLDIPYTNEQLLKEHYANYYTLACCAKKYTDSSKNRTAKIGIVGYGINSDSDAASYVAKYVDCTDNNEETYTAPFDSHTTHVANVITRNQVSTMSYPHYGHCDNNICSGVCNNVDLYSMNVVNQYGQSSIDYYIDAITYADENDINILSFSDLYKSNIRHISFEIAVSNYSGIIITSASNIDNAAFSNSDLDIATDYVYPTVCDNDNVMVVGNSVYVSGVAQLDSSSCYGQNTVDLCAPGYTFKTFGYDTGDGNGTSFSTPRVAGAAAVLLNINPDLTAAQIKHYIMAGVDKSTALTNKCVSGGSLNIYRSAKMLIADMACNWQTVFAGHFTDLNNMQVAAYCKAGENTLKAYVWTYNSTTGKFSDPEHMFTNYAFGLHESYADNMRRSVAGDFDGNGYDEICTLYDWNDYLFIEGADFYCHPGNIGLPVENFTGRVVAGDFDNDGKDEVAGLYYVPNVNSQTKLYLWDFSGTKSGMTATQEMVYDSGVGVYGALVITDRVVAGDFTGDGKDDIAALYNYGGTSYTLSIFEFGDGYAGRYALVSNRTDFDVGKVTGRVVACNINDTGRDEIICMYDNSDVGWGYVINYGFVYSSDSGSWQVQQLYTSNANTYAAGYSTHLMVAGDFTKDGYDDIVTFYRDDLDGTPLTYGKMYLCEAKYTNNESGAGYKNKWDSMA